MRNSFAANLLVRARSISAGSACHEKLRSRSENRQIYLGTGALAALNSIVSIIANSSATRTGFRIGRVGPNTAILARRTIWLSAPAMTIGFGVSEKPE